MSGLGVRARLRVLGLLWWSGSEGSEGLSMHTTVAVLMLTFRRVGAISNQSGPVWTPVCGEDAALKARVWAT